MLEELGIERGENLILMGVFLELGLFEVDKKTAEDAIVKRWPKFAENNLKALKLGYKYTKEISALSA